MSEDQKESAWAKIGEVRESKDRPGSFYVKADTYKGNLLFLEFDKDGRINGNLFRIDTINLRKRFDNEPEWVKEVLSINRSNQKATEAMPLEELIAELMSVANPERLKEILNSKAQTELAK